MASHDSLGPAPAFDTLRAYLEARAEFSEEDFALLRRVFVARHVPAGEFLQRAGDVPRHAAFVANGCLRSYVIDAKGKEHIVQFAPETWWLADSDSLIKGVPTPYFIDAVEDADLLLIDSPSHKLVLERVPGYGAAQRAGLQRHAAAKDHRIVSSLSASAEERYLEFLKTYPSIVQRVPQRMLASYLGGSPETLSRIRKNLSRK
jgi:CRP-like cAMP-binding protein